MKDRLDDWLSRRLVEWVDSVELHARAVLVLAAVVTVVLGAYAATHLGVNSDAPSMIAKTVPARAHYDALASVFPNLENALLVVVDGETPELARDAARRLAAAMRGEPNLFHDVDAPGADEFFETHGLLYLDVDDLNELADQIARVQPIIATVEREPTISHFATLTREGLDASDEDSAAATDWSAVLDRFGEATREAVAEHPRPVSWEDLLGRGAGGGRQVIVVESALDFESLFAARAPMARIRGLAAELGIDAAHGVRVRITGNPALNFEEMTGIMRDVVLGGVFCFAVVVFILVRALRSTRLVVAAVVTLLSGVVWTTSFAAASVGDLSIASISFAILLIGLGVDFTIHLGMAYADRLRAGRNHDDAMRDAVGAVGSSLVTCTLTTCVGFYAFIPTDNLGIAELGLIAGTGMIANLVATVTLFPALLTGPLRVDPARGLRDELHFRTRWWVGLEAHPRTVAAGAAVLLVFSSVIATGARIDPDVIRLRDPATESVQAFLDLLQDPGRGSPWPIEAMRDDLATATALARRVEALDVVHEAVTLADYVPPDQDEKLSILADLSMMLFVPPAPAESAAPAPAAQIESLRELRDFLRVFADEQDGSALGASARSLENQLDDFLARVETDADPPRLVASLERVLLSGLPAQMDRLRRATETGPIGMDDLPAPLVHRMIAPDGRARVQIFPSEILSDEDAFIRFADRVLEIVPDGSGIAINMIAFADATRDSFRQALAVAVVLISLFLYVMWQRISPVILVLAPLLLSSVVTVAAMVLLDIPFQLANVIVIPLLFGVGVDSGIHLVHRAEAPLAAREDLLATTTARAVFYSALTTTVGFGSLSLASHRGLSSLGTVLSLGMILTAASNLIVLPALVELRSRWSQRERA